MAVPPSFRLPAGPGHALPDALRQRMESHFRADFSSVRIHVGPEAPALGALAFTVGDTIVFAPGHYAPTTPRGQHLIGHELAHVVQQRQGRLHPPARSGIAIVRDAVLEREADIAASRLLQLHAAPAAPIVAPSRNGGLVQRMEQNLRDLDDFLDEQGFSDDEEPEDPDDDDFLAEPPGRPSKPSKLYQLVYGPASKKVTHGKTVYDAYPCNQSQHHKNCNARGNLVLVKAGKKGKSGAQMSPIGSGQREQSSPICHIIPWVHVDAEAKSSYQGSISDFEGFRKFLCWGNLYNLEPGYYRCNSKTGAPHISKKIIAKYVRLMKDCYDNGDNWPDHLVKLSAAGYTG